jgi:hypothetical protein
VIFKTTTHYKGKQRNGIAIANLGFCVCLSFGFGPEPEETSNTGMFFLSFSTFGYSTLPSGLELIYQQKACASCRNSKVCPKLVLVDFQE